MPKFTVGDGFFADLSGVPPATEDGAFVVVADDHLIRIGTEAGEGRPAVFESYTGDFTIPTRARRSAGLTKTADLRWDQLMAIPVGAKAQSTSFSSKNSAKFLKYLAPERLNSEKSVSL
jgi:hypothetical protein